MRDLLLVTWAVRPGALQRMAPDGVEIETVDGDGLLSLLAARTVRARAGSWPAPPHSELVVHTRVTVAGEPGLLVLSLRASAGGLAASLAGFPVRAARIRVREGLVRAPGIGVAIPYARGGGPGRIPEPPPGPTGRRRAVFFEAAGLRRLPVDHEAPAWERAEPAGPIRADAVLALGLDVGEPVSLLYSPALDVEADLSAGRVEGFGK